MKHPQNGMVWFAGGGQGGSDSEFPDKNMQPSPYPLVDTRLLSKNIDSIIIRRMFDAFPQRIHGNGCDQTGNEQALKPG